MKSSDTGDKSVSIGTQDAKGSIPSLRTIVRFFATLLLLGLIVTFPRLPIGVNDDSSWAAVLGYGHEHGLQFGGDLVFTYGPLGFLVTPYFCPQAPLLRLFSDLALSAIAVVGICSVAWRLAAWWRLLLLLLFAFIAGNCDPRSELLLYAGLFAWGMLCLAESRRNPVHLVTLACLCVFSALAKVTFLFVAAFTLPAVAAGILLRGKARLSLVFLAGSVLGGLLAWIAAGQHLANLWPFLTHAVAMSLGYGQAMAREEFPVLTRLALLMLALTLAVILLRTFWASRLGGKNLRWHRALEAAWFSGLAFFIWKHGFVRAGRDHAEIFLGVIPIMAMALAAFPARKRLARYLAAGAALACCFVALFALQWLFAGQIRSCLARPFKLMADHARILLSPAAYWSRMNELQKTESAAAQLPRLRQTIGRSSVDVFGFNQAYAVFNVLNFRPRPVFQSYAAYTEGLMQLNERFYTSASAPGYVLFRLEAMDNRFPPLEDALVLRRLLLDYAPVDAEAPFLLLKREQQTAPKLQPLAERTLRPGELFDLRQWDGSNLWLSVQLRPTLLGQMRTFFYQGPKVELGVWIAEAGRLKMARFDAPAPMLAAGFLANPLLLENQDLLDLYVGKPVAHAVAYSVELPPKTQVFWETTVQFKVYQVQNQLGGSAARDLDRLLSFPEFEATPERVVAPATKVLSVGGKPALALIGGGSLHFRIPAGAKAIKGNLGFAGAAYLLGGATEGAEFRIEEQAPDGTLKLLYSQTLKPLTNPEDRGMKPFEVTCPGTGDRILILRASPFSKANPTRELTCWSKIVFK